MPLHGHCMCNAIQVTLKDPPAGADPRGTMYCHCSNCIKQSGASGTFVLILPEDEVSIDGDLKFYEDKKTDSGTTLNRFFCGTCGCPVMSTSTVIPGKKVIKMGLFDSVPIATVEIYTKNRQEWELRVEGAVQVHAAS